MSRIPACWVLAALASLGSLARAEVPAEQRVAILEQRMDEMARAYEARIEALEGEVAGLKARLTTGAPAAPAPAGAATLPPSAPPPPAAGPSQTSNYFNPSVSVIGNFLGIGGTNRTDDQPSSSLRESEVGLQAIVDPYARADFFLSYGEEGVDVEEGFVTFNALPWKLLAKVGRMRSSFGKINTLHLHVLPWPDEPLPVANLLGGEEGWVGTGLSVARLVPLPGGTFSEATV